MASTITISCGNEQKQYQVNLSNGNLKKAFSHYNLNSNNKQQKLFDFSQKEYKTQDKTLYSRLCAALDSLKQLGGNKDIIDDADFAKGPINSEECKDNTWHNDDCMDVNAMDYHTDNRTRFFHIG